MRTTWPALSSRRPAVHSAIIAVARTIASMLARLASSSSKYSMSRSDAPASGSLSYSRSSRPRIGPSAEGVQGWHRRRFA